MDELIKDGVETSELSHPITPTSLDGEWEQDEQLDENETSIPGQVTGLPTWAQGLIRELRQENAARRTEIKRLKDDAGRIETARGETATQLEAALQERTVLIPRAERADALESYVREAVDKRIDALPSAYRPLVPTYADALQTLAWLDANAAVLTTPRAPTLDAGVRGETREARISAGEREIAARMGVTPEQYLRAKKS